MLQVQKILDKHGTVTRSRVNIGVPGSLIGLHSSFIFHMEDNGIFRHLNSWKITTRLSYEASLLIAVAMFVV